jgi:putative endonuclease
MSHPESLEFPRGHPENHSNALSCWWVYLLRCADGTFYTGITTDPERRVRQHNGELVGGARYTRPRRPVLLVYKEPCSDRSEAGKREASIRKLSRSRKHALISAVRKK